MLIDKHSRDQEQGSPLVQANVYKQNCMVSKGYYAGNLGGPTLTIFYKNEVSQVVQGQNLVASGT